MDIDGIKKLKTRYIDEVYSRTRAEQETDDSYINDTFDVPEISEPLRLLRSGIGRKVVDAPAEQIVTSNPQAHINVLKGNKETGERISKLINQEWIPVLKQQNPNPFKESVKNKQGRGESYIKVVHNESWVTKDKVGYGLPVHFLILDPMVIYGDPEEDSYGRPKRVIVSYPRQLSDVLVIYPGWTNPKNKNGEGDQKFVEWFEYWDEKDRYFEADGEPVLSGEIQSHLYGNTPFIRKYSGFGRRSRDGEMSSLIVSDIRFGRDLIREECAIRSDIASSMHLFAHPRIDLFTPAGIEVDRAQLEQEYDMGAGAFNVLPAGIPPDHFKEGLRILPTREAFEHLQSIRSEINQRYPFIMAGFPMGSSGRQQDMSSTQAMRRYDTVIENTEIEWETAFEMALQICKKIPTLWRAIGLREEDKKVEFKCIVRLKEKDPIEADRLSTLGERLWNTGNGSIDLMTNLVEYQGRTEDKAKEIIANILVDRLTLYNPDVAEVMGMVFAEESGMEKWIEMAKQRRMMMEEQQGMQKPQTKTAQQRTQGEVNTQLGREQAPEAGRGARTPPQGYVRG